MWDLMKKGLGEPIKRKIKKEIKQDKKKKEESNLPPKKPATGTTRRTIETPLDETEALLKKKVSIGELNEYMEVQEDRKKRREDAKLRGTTLKPGQQPRSNLLAELFKDSPDKLEAMSPDNLLKLSMLQGGGGGGGGMNPLLMMMLMNKQTPNQNQGPPQKATSLLDLVKAMKELKSLTKEDQKPAPQGNDMNQAITLMLMERLMQNNQAPQQGTNQLDLVKYLTTIIADQNKMKEELMTDKLRQLEFQITKYDPMEEGAKMIEYMKNFKTLFGGNMTPEGLKHELDLKRLEIEEQREMRHQGEDDRKMIQIGSIIEKTVDTLSETLAVPIAKGLEKRMAQSKKRKEYSGEGLPDDIDLAELEAGQEYDENINPGSPPEDYTDISAMRRRNRSRFRIVDSGEGLE